ncbi:MAG: hypothetical protein AB8H47_11180 [Bacteroidia bacterium]
MKHIALLSLILLILGSLEAQVKPVSKAEFIETPVYKLSGTEAVVEVEMSYASAKVQKPEIKKRWESRTVTQVDLVFTKYPHDFDSWLINYETLLQRRLSALMALDSNLLTNPDIKWRYVLQTDCETEPEAKALFHGFVLYLEDYDHRMASIEKILIDREEIADSTAYLVLERHPEWQSKLVVMDWTGSMYPYGASVLLWHALHIKDSSISHFVFFNDGNARPNDRKPLGKTGGIYRAPNTEIDSVLSKMYEVMDKGNGGDVEENDLEALLKSTSRLKNYKEVILIADNRSAVRDLKLIKYLKLPVKVVLCGVDENYPVHPDYLAIARYSKGSVHTMEEDLQGLADLLEGDIVKIGGSIYRLQKGRFVLQDRS